LGRGSNLPGVGAVAGRRRAAVVAFVEGHLINSNRTMMKNGCKLPAFAASLVAINAMTILISQRNLRAGVYPVNADSIAIPIASTLLASIAVVPFLLGIAFLPGSAFVSQLLIKRAGWAILIIACLVLLYLPPAAFAVLGGDIGQVHATI